MKRDYSNMKNQSPLSEEEIRAFHRDIATVFKQDGSTPLTYSFDEVLVAFMLLAAEVRGWRRAYPKSFEHMKTAHMAWVKDLHK